MRVILPVLAASLLLAACTDHNSSESTTTSTTDTAALSPAAAITLTDVPASPEFPDARLGITGIKATPVGTDSVKLSVTFDVKNFELKSQTTDAGGKLCNNSAQGQHIHFILDNKPYVALYEPKHEVTVPVNTEHYLMCFLSRSYHESVKSQGAGVLAQFKVDAKGVITRGDSVKTPMLFYSRPKGDYLAADTANVLLDFYPVNAAIGTDYKVKADVKNETTGRSASFTIDQWKPNFLHGLGTGKATVVLTLIDKNGQQVSGPNTTITREIRLAAAEPMP